MTATPRVYGDRAIKKAKDLSDDAILCSMDDETLYGPVFFRLSFGQAVQQGLLSDYKVLILTTKEGEAERSYRRLESLRETQDNNFVRGDYELDISDVAKLIGCWRGLAKQGYSYDVDGKFETGFEADPEPMKRAVAFCGSIKMSKAVVDAFNHLNCTVEEDEWEKANEEEFESLATTEVDESNNEHLEKSEESERLAESGGRQDPTFLHLNAEHIDGSFASDDRERLLGNLRNASDKDTCHILSNVRCLSEGVDVPNLDAALFLSPRNSQVDVIQAVGRVMRRAEGKKYGYIILPIVIPVGVEPEEALNDNTRYKVIWQTLQAIRSHDDRFRIMINQIQVGEQPSSIKLIGTGDGGFDSSTEYIDKGTKRYLPGVFDDPDSVAAYNRFKDAMFVQIVKRCGDRDYLEQWAKDVGKITASRIEGIRKRLHNPTEEQARAFKTLNAVLRREINPSIDEEQTIELLTQHITTLPVFDALFPEKAFARSNPVARQMETVVQTFNVELSDAEQELESQFKADIAARIEGISTAQGRQSVIHKLYEQFFTQALPKMAEKLGIVYTPVEVVDYILHSVDYVLQKEFSCRLTTPRVHILDPFTGTGTFIARLFETGLIEKKNIRQKYRESLHANEIMLLAYYIATVNIEETYYGQLEKYGLKQPSEYEPFPGIVLTDTFQSTENDLPERAQRNLDGTLVNASNNERLNKQRRQIIKVIVGNPPYSVGQKSGNDNNQNEKYPRLDSRIAETYAARSNATNKNSLYDSYIKAFRWASDRVTQQKTEQEPEENIRGGVVAFVSNGAFIDNTAMEGFRKCLFEEFSEIYVFNLRGNQRTSGELSRKEGGKIFGSGSRTPVAITILVKKPNKPSATSIHYCDIGDYLTRDQKLDALKEKKSIAESKGWVDIIPNEKGDWINQRNGGFEKLFELAGKKDAKERTTFFGLNDSIGLQTSRDAWIYNYSKQNLIRNMELTVTFYNEQIEKYSQIDGNKPDFEDFVDRNPRCIKWSGELLQDAQKGIKRSFGAPIRQAAYRPFCKEWLYFDDNFVHRVGKMKKIFPTDKTNNLVISIPSVGTKGFSAIITNKISDLEIERAGHCFSLYYYEPLKEQLFNSSDVIIDGYIRRDAITDAIHNECVKRYGMSEGVTKEDIFFYVYGALHCPDYRRKYEAELKKELARLPLPKKVQTFWNYSELGRRLADIHINYETGKSTILDRYGNKQKTLEEFDLKIRITGSHELMPQELYRVDKKMKLGTESITDEEGTKRKRFTGALQFNDYISFSGIPQEAFKYVVNGRSPIEWLVERYYVRTDKDSGIVDDPNLWSDDPKYIYNLVCRLVAVSVETYRLTSSLPSLED